MSHTFRHGVRGIVGPVALVLTLTHSVAAAQKPTASPTRPVPQGLGPGSTPAESPEATAEQTREQFEGILEKYPPAVGRVLKLDPSLMNNQAYMTPYPLLTAFISQHPEITHNPGYFLENVNNPNQSANDPKWRQRQEFYALLGGLAGFIAFLVLVGGLVWVIRMIVMSRRWNKLSRVQYEVHSKLLDRFTSNEDLLAYMQTPAGRRFLEAAPLQLPEEPKSMAAPLSRILWSAQAGIILLLAGIGLLYVSGTLIDEPAELFRVIGVVSLALGGGFIVSAIAAYLLSRRLGLLTPAPADNA